MNDFSQISLQLASEILGGKWKLLILQSLLAGTRRFNQLLAEVYGITPKMLSKELKFLENHSIIKRTQYNTVPPTVEYNLRNFDGELRALIKAFTNFAKNYVEQQQMERTQVPEKIDFVI